MRPYVKIIVPLMILGLGIAGAGLLIKFRKQTRPIDTRVLPPLVETTVAKVEDHQFRIATQGTVEPRTEIQLAVEVPGRVMEVSPALDNGSFFEEGEVLLTIDRRDFELALIQAQARVEEARYRLQLEKAEAEVARQEWERLGQGDSNPLLLRQPQLAQAQAALAGSEASLEQAQRDLERCRVKAPFAGRVAQKLVDAGEFVARGTAVARIYAVDYAEVRLPLTADQLAFVDLPLHYRGEAPASTRPTVNLTARLAGQPHTWTGVVDRVEGKIDPRTRMLFVVARVADPYGRTGKPDQPPLAAGLFVEAEILGNRVGGVMVLPRTALRGKDEVLVVDENNRLHRRSVAVWRADRDKVVVQSGLQEGERVCLSTLDVVVDNMRVRLTAHPPPATAKGEAHE